MARVALRTAVALGALAVLLYALGLGVYAVSSVTPEVPTQPETEEQAREALERLGLADDYPFPHRFLATPHGRMHYADVGSGPVLLCLHGNPTWSFLYRHLIAALSDRARLVAPDLIGYGLSEKLPDPDAYTIAGHVEDVAALVGALDLRDVTVVAHGFGTVVGMGVALREPERVRALVVLNGFAPSSDGEGDGLRVPPVVRLVRVPVVGEELVQGLGVLHRVEIRSGLARRESRQPEVLRAYRAVQASWEERAAALAFPRLLPPDGSREARELLRAEDRFMRSFRDPVLLVWGLRDRVFRSAVLSAWRARVPHARVVEIEDAGHLVPEDAPQEVAAALRAFLDSIGREDPAAPPLATGTSPGARRDPPR